MNRDRSDGIWKQAHGRVKQLWGTLIHDRIAIDDGAREQIEGRNQEQRGISKQEADRQLEEFLSRNRNWWDLSGR
jgi:uncharacterized protein YjbJ (UPF0337 family)